MLFDTHAHLHFPDFSDDLDAVLDRARAAGVRGVVTIGTDRETNRAVVELARRLPEAWATGGIHPHDAAEATEADSEEMEGLARSDAARFVPADHLVVETDCPYLPPTPHRGKRNEPAYVALTAARIAELRGVDAGELGDITTRNAARLFRLRLDQPRSLSE